MNEALQALKLLDQIAADATVNRNSHEISKRAVQILMRALQELAQFRNAPVPQEKDRGDEE